MSGTGGFPGSANTLSISADGNRIAFRSTYSNLVGEDTEGESDVFVRDVAAGVTTRVSVVSAVSGGFSSAAGVGGNRESKEPVISRNGRHVVFRSVADNLVASDMNESEDTFVHDLLTRTTTLVSMSRAPGAASSSASGDSPPSAGMQAEYDISDSGRFVLFTSLASDLLDPADGVVDTNGTTDVYLLDRDADRDGRFDEPGPTGTSTTLVSINADGTDASDSPVVAGGSTAVSLSGDGRYAVFTSGGTDLIPGGTSGGGLYVRDLVSESTEFIAIAAGSTILQAGVAESGIATAPLRVAFTSFETDVDPDVVDDNGEDGDVFIYDAPTDLKLLAARADGNERLVIGYSVENEPAEAPFEIGVYLSTDGTFDPSEDDLLDTITLDGSDLDVGGRKIAFDIGGGEGEVALPGAGAPEVDFDYQILFVLDHLDVQDEIDTDPFNDDNTGRFEGIYHPPGGSVFVHGRTGSRFEDDSLTVTEVDASTLEVRLGKRLETYDPADVTSVRFRGHEGDDFAQAGGTADLLLGGAGRDRLRGGAGDDTIDGGPDADSLFGEAGFDTIFDGMGDDLVDLGAGWRNHRGHTGK